MSKILFIGDVVGKPGRKALAQVLPEWKEKYKPDVVIVNVENLAHGKGVTPATLAEVDALGVDCFTSGNHIYKKNGLSTEGFEHYEKLIRPANFPENMPGHGYYRFAKGIKGENGEERGQQFLIINLNGQVFMEKQFDGVIANPFTTIDFTTIDKLISEQSQKGDIIFVDFHAEATSEKIAMGYYLDGRASIVVGTHTHVPTADNRVLPSGTAYITDVGMVGTLNSVIGVKKENVLKKFLNPEEKFVNELEEEGVLQVNGVLVEIDDLGKAEKIEKLYKEI
jgi:2',3'-cyclic-nucleotide 2'-phosphodiesterase